jgi:beta-N-acetylhexosaminidase
LVILATPDGLAAPLFQDDSTKTRAQALLDTLTPEERVGQLFLVTFTGITAQSDSQIYDLIVNHHVGGVILQASNDNFAPAPQTLNQTIQLVRELQSREWTASQSRQIDLVTGQEFSPAFIPMFIGISQEGNAAPYDQILSGLTPLPSQMALGATWNTDLARQTGAVLGAELAALGFNLLMGPSLDVLENPRQQGFGDLGVRTFGGDPYWVGEMGRAYIEGIHSSSLNRMAVVAKHFPGHGSSDRLPEEEVATVRKSLEQLKRIELPPFYAITGNAATQEGQADALLASHIRYQGFQGNIRETTRPVSFDRQAFDGLMSLPPFASWRENGGVIISDDLGSWAFRRFIDPTGVSFSPRFIARDAFLTGNDLLFVGKDFVAPTDPDTYETIKKTLAFFAQKYRDDPAFRQRVDESALRILTLKHRLYQNDFSIDQVLPSISGLANLGKSGQVTFQVAQEAGTLISPSLTGLSETLPEPPNINDRIIFISDARNTQQCSTCPAQPILATDSLESAVTRLYGPSAAGQVLPRNLQSYSFQDLQFFLDGNEEIELDKIEEDFRQSNWIVFAMLNVSTELPSSQALSRFLAERPDLFRQKKMVVFAFDAPYYLDATEVSKLNAFFGLYSKAPPFIEVAARLLFGELPTPPGDLPVSVLGVDYDLISATAPDPAQTIQLFLDNPSETEPEGTATPEPTPVLEFKVGDLIPVRTSVILDHNGHPVPDDTPVTFLLNIEGDVASQTEYTLAGVARTTFLVNQSGTLEIRAESDQAQLSTILRFDIPPEEGALPPATTTAIPSETPTPSVTPSITPTVSVTPAPATRDHTNLGDWFLALFVTLAVGGTIYWLTALFGVIRWGVRSGLLALIGGLIAYTYLAVEMPGSKQLLADTGAWGVFLTTFLGSSVGWGAAWSWQRFDMNSRLEKTSAQKRGEQAEDY